jgi:hypothetical protein
MHITIESAPVVPPAQIVVGVLSHNNADTISDVLRTAHTGLRTYFGSQTSVVVNVDSGSSDETRTCVSRLREEIGDLETSTPEPQESKSFRALLDLARQHHARAYLVLSPSLRSLTPDWIDRLVRPVLDERFDLVAPCYSRHPFEGTLTAGLAYPLTRALYGKRLRQPMGGDLAFSPALADHFARTGVWSSDVARMATDARASVEALCHGFRVGQAHVGPLVHALGTPPDLSAVLTDVLGSLFDEMSRHAPFWQKVRGSEPVHTFGTPTPLAGDAAPEATHIDAHKAFESFCLGCANLRDIWGLVLPPGTLLDLARLARVPADRFELPDELWARLVYDFALGYRLRTMTRGHLLRAFTPLYMGWLASFMLQLRGARTDEVEARLERLAQAYESQKPYLISRWRWPDRFHP